MRYDAIRWPSEKSEEISIIIYIFEVHGVLKKFWVSRDRVRPIRIGKRAAQSAKPEKVL